MGIENKLNIGSYEFEELERIYETIEFKEWHNKEYIYYAMRKHYAAFFSHISVIDFDILYNKYKELREHKGEYANLTIDLDALRRGGL